MTTKLMSINDPATFSEGYRGMVRRKGDTGLWVVKYFGKTLEEVLVQHSNNPKSADYDIRVCQTIVVSRIIFDSNETQVKS